MLQRLLATAAIAAASLTTLSADNWPAWRGPTANGVSPEKSLPLKWSAAEGVTWKLPLPTLSVSPASATICRAPRGESVWRRPRGRHR